MSDGGDVMYPKKRRVQRACDVCRRKKSASLKSEGISRLTYLQLSAMCVTLMALFLHPFERSLTGDGQYDTNTECSYCEEYGHKCTYIGTGQVRSKQLKLILADLA